MNRLIIVFFLVICFSPARARILASDSTVVIDTMAIDSFYKTRQIDIQKCDNPSLYYEVFRHYGTCYRIGGVGKGSFDCSGFVQTIFKKIYGKDVPHSAAALFEQCTPNAKKEVPAEGDLVFFKINKGRISHVGIYLQHDKFAHASVQSGIVISDLSEAYYARYYFKSGRIN